MTGTPTANARNYEIRLKGHLEALHGILKKVRDVGLPLLSVNSVEPGTETDRTSNPAQTT